MFDNLNRWFEFLNSERCYHDTFAPQIVKIMSRMSSVITRVLHWIEKQTSYPELQRHTTKEQATFSSYNSQRNGKERK
jgi:hypothetical protein